MNQASPSAKYLQRELKKAGYMSNSIAEADNYGPATQSAVAFFYRDHPQWGYSGSQIGPTGWAHLLEDNEDPAAPPVTVNASTLLSALAALPSTTVSTSKYPTDSGLSGTVDVKKTSTGVLWWKADMDIDTDGEYFPGSEGDPYRQSQTSYQQSNGLHLNLGISQVIVIPLASSRFDYRQHGIRGGDSAIIIYNNKMVYAFFGDQGPSGIIGEASYAAARDLGVPNIPQAGIDASTVTYIVFPGQAVSPIESHKSRKTVGQNNAVKLIQDAGGAPPPPPPPTGGTINLYETGPSPDATVAANMVVQDALNREYGGVVIDGWFGPVTTAKYKQWQESLYGVGTQSDGIPGPGSLTALGTKYGFSVTQVVPPGEPTHSYTRTTYGGRTVNQRTRTMLINAANEFGSSLTLTQGSYNPGGVSASAGTHDGGGVVDIAVDAYSSTTRANLVQILRKKGFAAWLRTPAQGFAYHIHAVAIGDREMSSAAESQVVQYFSGYNGLSGWGPDTDPPRPFPAWAMQYND